MNNEVWKQIEDYPNYFISNTGKIRNVKTGRELSQRLTRYGYLEVHLCKNGKQNYLKIHRLVAQAFIPNPDNLDTVDHLNSIKTDNRIENLRWLSRSENSKRFHREQKTEEWKELNKLVCRKNFEKANEKAIEITKKPIVCIETGKIYESLSQASRELNLTTSNICNVLKGKYSQTHGLHFKYLLEDNGYEK